MLENEPQGGEREEVSAPPSVDAADSTTAAPARRTRAPRRKAVAAADTSVTVPVDAPGAEPGAADEAANAVDAAAAAEAPAPVKATRSRARKKAAPAAAAPEADTPADADAAEAPTPVKATRSRARKKAVPAAAPEELPIPVVATPAPAPEPDSLVAEAVEEEEDEQVTEPVAEQTSAAVPVVGVLPLDDELVEEAPTRRRSRKAALPPAVLFMPPEPDAEPAPALRRTRRGTTAAAVTEPVLEPAAATPVEADAVAETAEEEPAEGVRRSRRRRRGAAAEVDEAVAEQPALEEADETADDVEDGAADEDEDDEEAGRRRRRRGRRGRGRGKGPADEGDETDENGAAEAEAETDSEDEETDEGDGVTRRRRRRRRKGSGDTETGGVEDGVHTVVRVREPRRSDEVQGVSGSTRLEAKRQRRRDGREQRRTRPPILSESEFLARREAVDRVMVVRQKPDRTQIAVLEDGILVEHYVSRSTSGTMVGNVYLGKVQNVLPSMEAAFVDVGRGRNAVLYAGEVNWDATGLEGRARSIEQALRSGDSVLVQVTKDPIGHKGARLSSHIALSGRHLVYVPNGNASGISRKLPDNERKRLRDVLKKLVPDGAGVIVRTAAEGASEEELERDVRRLQAQWEDIQAKAAEGNAPRPLSEEPDLVIRVVRDLFNEDFRELIVQGERAYDEIEDYLESVSPDLKERLHRHTGTGDVFADKRIDEQILKGLDRKVFLPSGGHLVIDRTEAMTVVDVNTGKYTGAGGNLEETVTRNNLEAAEETVRQLRLRDLGGIVVIDFIDMVLESNRELVLRRLTECLGRDRTKHQVTEITSLGLVQMTRKRIGAGLLEAFSENCEHCKGRGLVIHTEPVAEKRSPGSGGNGGNGGSGAANQVKAVAAAARTEAPSSPAPQASSGSSSRSRRRRGGGSDTAPLEAPQVETPQTDVAAAEMPHVTEDPVAETAGLPPAGSGVITRTPQVTTSAADDDYDISGYDLSRYETNGTSYAEEPMQLTGADDPDAADDDDDEDDEPVGAGAGGRRRSRRGGSRRRTRP
ncbi:Rne/Rng family ribonuclease [Actinoplanes sp. NPDC051859]|uniref:Rne/Rng family ribonuclease n=1 Tax=Actinoplanes sp. NPDC051859 TaxID=3363909 RepID=UPI0037BBEFBD